MATVPPAVVEFLSGKRIVVAGVSRAGGQPANAIARKLRDVGHEVVAVNPHAGEIDGFACYPSVAAVPGAIHGVMIVTHPQAAAETVRQAAARGVQRIWFHRSVDAGSVSDEALAECARAGITPIVGGCPMMYCNPDVVHRCMRAVLAWMGKIP